MKSFFAGLILALIVPGVVAMVPAESAAAAPTIKNVPDQIKSASSGKFKKFYKARGYLPVWVRKGMVGPEADRFIALLRTAYSDGLDPRDYGPDMLKRAVDEARADPKLLGKAELKLSKAFFAYARDMRATGAGNEEMLYADRRLQPKRLNPSDLLVPLAIAPSLSGYLDEMRWMSPFYVDLRNALVMFRARWGTLSPVTIASGPTLRQGAKGDRVRQLRHRLGLRDSVRFDSELARRLKVFQADHGLSRTGVVDAETLLALSRDSRSYEASMRLNLERARHLPPATVKHVVVNLASARLWMIDGKLSYADSMRVIVGAPDEKTPLMAGMISYAILNPYWNIPTDLVRDRVAPKVLRGQSFTAMHYEALSDWSADASIIPPDRIDWQAVAAGRRELRVRMLPGGENWMGKVKFMLPNDLGIYLHDFPDKTIFAEPDRHRSSGCIRLEDAARLGTWLFGKTLRARSSAPEQFMSLPAPVPVYMTYLTVVPDVSGIAFVNDAYRRDRTERYAVAADPL